MREVEFSEELKQEKEKFKQKLTFKLKVVGDKTSSVDEIKCLT